MSELLGIYAGSLRALEPEGQATGIFKQALLQAEVTRLGIVGDHQADRRVHGGPDKALHEFARSSYAAITTQFPQLVGTATAGTFGENLSSADRADADVCIGDTVRIGEVVVQVSQPRRPCWKINHRFECRELSHFVERWQLTGWYYRVLEPGMITLGDRIELLERVNDSVTVAAFTKTVARHRPDPDALNALINATGLNEEWRARLTQRRDYLAARPSAAQAPPTRRTETNREYA
ncbi:MAG: MOSC domain-containing protein [Gammaproteobacteria bacterium]|jgi:MOSC domain-containing protein YiiM